MTKKLWFLCAPHTICIEDQDVIADRTAQFMVSCIAETLTQKSHCVITTSAGHTLKQTYSVLRERYTTQLDWSRVICIQMDEYANLGCEAPNSFAHQISTEVIAPLGIGKFIRFYDATGAAMCSLEQYENDIRALGGIDLAIHGLGQNGHIAFNEPEPTLQPHTRQVRLAAETISANKINFEEGVTLGIEILCEAKTSAVVLLGIQKRMASTRFLYHPPGSTNPAAFLARSGRVCIYLDSAAAPITLMQDLGKH